MGNVLAVLEQRDGAIKSVSYEVVTAARTLADERGGAVHALVVGAAGIDVSSVGAYGAEEIIQLQSDDLALYQSDAYGAVIAEHCQNGDFEVVLVAGTAMGKDLGPRIAARLSCPLAADVTAISGSGDFTVDRPVYSGKAVYTLKINSPQVVISVRPNVFTAAENPKEPTQSSSSPEVPEIRARTSEIKAPDTAKLDVAEASVVVSGGRGLKEPEHFSLVEDLAAAFGNAAVGASRAVVDAGWRSHAEQVGQTGKTVSPELYIAVGISGAVQHLAGMKTSGVIVAINKDKDAPIFKVADYGIVGDLFEVMPKLTEEVRKIRGG
jgi:electron transfer flavoprotein alpha subunit